jgi:hypothetical protein
LIVGGNFEVLTEACVAGVITPIEAHDLEVAMRSREFTRNALDVYVKVKRFILNKPRVATPAYGSED